MANLADPYLGRRVLEFIDAAGVATHPQQVMALFEAAVGEFGFHTNIMAGIPTSDILFESEARDIGALGSRRRDRPHMA